MGRGRKGAAKGGGEAGAEPPTRTEKHTDE